MSLNEKFKVFVVLSDSYVLYRLRISRERAGLNKVIVSSQRTGYINNQHTATWSMFLCAFLCSDALIT